MSLSRNTLKEYDLRHTGCREDILQSFQANNHALSHGDLENQFGERFDRVTIYRTLKTFVEKGIIHKVLDDEGGTKYALCRATECKHDEHHHDHVHFKCLNCGNTTCIESVHIPKINLPEGYKLTDINMLMQGTCPNCNA
ncbi:Fur family transcriptional regulator [Emticicia sp. 17c]|uniref:Fur family transcriptional regulator n=1 Tax=Emticicia sp. 17c TaxID=3127704 RepID=UPI00301C8C37